MVQKWNIPEIGVEENDKEEVTSIFCKICREFYANNNADLIKLNGAVKQVVLNWISGSKTIKKNKVLDHLKANYHQSAVWILKEHAAEKSQSPQITEGKKLASTIKAASCSEKNILTHFQQLNLRQREQLKKKFSWLILLLKIILPLWNMKSLLTSKKSFTKSIWVLVFLMIRVVMKLSFSYQIQQLEKMLWNL